MESVLMFIGEHFLEIIVGLISASVFGYVHKYLKQQERYRALEEKEKLEKADARIDEKLEPVLNDIEELREYIRVTELKENKDIKLIISSYRFRLIQLCRLYLKQGYLTEDQFEQINAFYDLYKQLGGNGEAEVYYNKVKELDIIPE